MTKQVNNKPYLTLDEYKALTFRKTDFSTADDFKKMLFSASNILDVCTNYFFMNNTFEATDSFVVERFKIALCEQIKYLFDNDATASNEIDNSPSSVSIGSTSISYNNKNNTNNNTNYNLSVICKDALFYLNNTGLLFKGI